MWKGAKLACEPRRNQFNPINTTSRHIVKSRPGTFFYPLQSVPEAFTQDHETLLVHVQARSVGGVDLQAIICVVCAAFGCFSTLKFSPQLLGKRLTRGGIFQWIAGSGYIISRLHLQSQWTVQSPRRRRDRPVPPAISIASLTASWSSRSAFLPDSDEVQVTRTSTWASPSSFFCLRWTTPGRG